jgi:sulfate permease, SulP family
MGVAAAEQSHGRGPLVPTGAAFTRGELAGAVADLGVLLPIAVTLIVANGLSATAVLLPAALLYLFVAYAYALPVPVQPLKAFGAIAIAQGLGVGEIASGALLVGAIFIVLGSLGLIDLAARAFPRPLIRGVQLTVGLLFLQIAWGLLTDPPQAFTAGAMAPLPAVALGAVALGLLLWLRNRAVSLALVGVGAVVMLVASVPQDLVLGPSDLSVPEIDGGTLLTALTVLVIPQLPLTFANSCLATADAARTYFGDAARRIRPGRLAVSLGAANLFAGGIGGMPVCHGAGGMTAHYKFGARTGGAPLAIGAVLLVIGVAAGAGLAPILAAFPLPILAALLAAAGVLHIALIQDVREPPALALVLAVGVVGFLVNLAVALAAGLVVWWGIAAIRRRMASSSSRR